MQGITGNVTGKIQFKIDKPSWDNLDKFSKKLTAIKRQMSTMHKSINVQAVVKEVKSVGEKVAKASTNAKKLEYNGHVVAFQKHQQQMDKLYDQALREDRRRDAARIRQAERFNAAQLRSDKALDRQRRRASGSPRLSGGYSADRYEKEFELYSKVKLRHAEFAGISEKGREDMRQAFRRHREDYAATGDWQRLKGEMKDYTDRLIHANREQRKNSITLRSLRNDVVQLTAAYTAFSGIQNIAMTGFEFEGLRAAAKVFAGDEAGVASHMQFIADEADRLGTNLMISTKEFTKFAIATKGKVSQQAARNIFSGISEYAAVLQADPQQFERAFRAVNQMLSKGNLMAEEVEYSFPM